MDNVCSEVKKCVEMHFPMIWRSKSTDLVNCKKTQSLGKNGCRQKCLNESPIHIYTFLFRETTKLLFTLKLNNFFISYSEVLNYTFFCIWIAFWPKSLGPSPPIPNGEAYSTPPTVVNHLIIDVHSSLKSGKKKEKIFSIQHFET